MDKTKVRTLLVIILITFCFNFLLIIGHHNTLSTTQRPSNLMEVEPEIKLGSSELPTQAWNVTWGGSDSDGAYDLVIDRNESIYCVGFADDFGAKVPHLALVKFNPNGTLAWNLTDDVFLLQDGTGIGIDPSGAIICVGNYGADMGVVKFYPNGTKAWNVTWGDLSLEHCYGGAIDSNGSIYCVGYKPNPSYYEMLLVKFFSNGTQAWNTTWGGSYSEIGWGITVDTADMVYCVGDTVSFGAGGYDLALVKFHPNGTLLWNTTWGGIAYEEGWDVVVDDNGSVYCVGTTESFATGPYDMALVKFHPNGSLAWNTTWGGIGDEAGRGITLDASGGIYCIGETDSFGAGDLDMVLVKFHPNGTFAWNSIWAVPEDNYGLKVALGPNGSIYCAGFTDDAKADLVLVKYTSEPPIIPPPSPPISPYDPSPMHGATGVNTSLILSVTVSDPDDDMMNVTFYNAANDNLIGTALNVPNGGRTSVEWNELSAATIYSWYVIADDGIYATQSATWSFTTASTGGIPGFNPIICIISMLGLLSVLMMHKFFIEKKLLRSFRAHNTTITLSINE
jgi:uncharacterized delta-60 repeat protein